MNKSLAVLLLLAAVMALVVFWPGGKPAGPPAKTAAAQDAAVARALATVGPRAAAIIASNFPAAPPATILYSVPEKPAVPAAGPPAPLEFTNLAPAIVLDNVRTAIRNYGSRFGGNPVGTNPEITRALGGENPGQVNFLNADAGLRVNAAGELVDAWGTPFFFHQLSGHEMEIHSAGPDKIMWTADDLVTE